MSKNFLKSFMILALIAILTIPALSFAQKTLVPCGITDAEILKVYPSYAHACGFNDLLTLVNIVMSYILTFSISIAAIMFAYAGFTMVTSGGSAEKATKAKKIFTNVALGLIFVAAAWLIVKLVLSVLGYQGSWIGF